MNPSAPSSPEIAENQQRAVLQTKLEEVAAQTGFARETVAWIFWAVVSHSPENASPEEKRRGLGAEALCVKLIRHANDTCPGELRLVLEANRIQCSEDIGEIVNALIDAGLLRREEDDYFTDFDGLFETGRLRVFLAQHGIRRRWVDWPGMQRRLVLTCFAFAIAALVTGYFQTISMPWGWISGSCAAAGLVIALLPPGFRARPRS